MPNRQIESFKGRIASVVSFLSSDLAVYSGSMSFLSILTLIPFLMLGIFAAVNLSFFAELFNEFRNFLYANLFEESVDIIVYYINIFLQNSSKLGFFGLIFALYSVFVFIKQLDYCIHRLCKIEDVFFGVKRFLKYFTVMGFAILSVFISTGLEALGGLFGFGFSALLASILQIWFAIFLFFLIISPVKKSVKQAALYALLSAAAFSLFKKLFVYYLLFGGSYGTIYGSFAIVFWFFVWLNLSWYIFFVSFKLYVNGGI